VSRLLRGAMAAIIFAAVVAAPFAYWILQARALPYGEMQAFAMAMGLSMLVWGPLAIWLGLVLARAFLRRTAPAGNGG
jgi:hypothetical protein